MALVLLDRAQETTIVVGTTVSAILLGAAPTYQSFAGVGNGNTTYYCIADQAGGLNWEVGLGTYTLVGTIITRAATPLSSSNAGASVSFPAGTKDVFIVYPSSKGVWLDASGNAIGLGTPAAFVGTNITGTATAFTASNVTTNANLTGGVTSVGNAATVVTNANLTGAVTSVGNAATVVTNANLTGAVTSVGNASSLGSFTSAQLATALTDETGSGSAVFATSPTLVTPALGTPSALVGTNITGTATSFTASNVTTNANLTGAITSSGSNATSLGSFTSANLAAALTDETGTGSAVFATSPTLVTPALGIPASGVVTNLTGTASININGTVGATTATTGAFTTLAYTGTLTGSTGILNIGSGQVYKDASGNVGIGTSSPSSYGKLAVLSSDNTEATAIQSLLSNNTTAQLRLGFNRIIGYNTTAGNSSLDLGVTSSPQAVHIDSSGNVGIGTSSPSQKLHVVGSQLLSNPGSAVYTYFDSTTAAYVGREAVAGAMVFGVNSAERMRIDTGGSLILVGSIAQKASGTTWSNPSDIRLKDSISPYTKGLNELMQVAVKEWEYNGKGGTTEGLKSLGVIADEVMLILPNTVDTYKAKLNADDEEDSDIKKFDATEITWLMLKSIQELKAIIDTQQEQINSLLGK